MSSNAADDGELDLVVENCCYDYIGHPMYQELWLT